MDLSDKHFKGNYDPEKYHIDADELLLAALSELGYEVEPFRDAVKYYS